MNFQSHPCNIPHKIILSCIFVQAKKIDFGEHFHSTQFTTEKPIWVKAQLHVEKQRKDLTSASHLPP